MPSSRSEHLGKIILAEMKRVLVTFSLLSLQFSHVILLRPGLLMTPTSHSTKSFIRIIGIVFKDLWIHTV